MPVLSSIVYTLKQDKAQYVGGLTLICLVLPHKTTQWNRSILDLLRAKKLSKKY